MLEEKGTELRYVMIYFLDRIHKLQDKSLSKEDEELLHNQVNNFSIDNYDLKKVSIPKQMKIVEEMLK